MENAEVIEQLVDINEEVAELREHPDEETVERLIQYIISSQNLILKYKPREGGKVQLAEAFLKMLKVEELARDYDSLHEETLSVFDLEIIFDAYQEAFEAFLGLS
jgi:hypothetical protein